MKKAASFMAGTKETDRNAGDKSSLAVPKSFFRSGQMGTLGTIRDRSRDDLGTDYIGKKTNSNKNATLRKTVFAR